jgi:methionyl-tRNA formyltransferase
MPARKIKIVYMGTPMFAVPPLEILLADADFDVLTVVTQEDKKTGRKQVVTAPPVKAAAILHNIPVLQPPSLKGNPEIVSLIKGLKPDFIVVVAFGQILPREILDIPKSGCVNLHGSLLPKYRGASPVEEALRNGDNETGITFIKMDDKLDSGNILLVQRLKIDPADNALILREKLCLLGTRLLPYLLKDIKDGLISPIPQNHSKATYCRKIRKEDGLVDLKTMSARQIVNHIRAYTPWPQCYLVGNGKRLKIIEAEFDENTAAPSKIVPGEIVATPSEKIGLATQKGILIPKTVQLEGKKAMPFQDFLRGNPGFFK